MAADRRMTLESPVVNLADRMATEPKECVEVKEGKGLQLLQGQD